MKPQRGRGWAGQSLRAQPVPAARGNRWPPSLLHGRIPSLRPRWVTCAARDHLVCDTSRGPRQWPADPSGEGRRPGNAACTPGPFVDLAGSQHSGQYPGVFVHKPGLWVQMGLLSRGAQCSWVPDASAGREATRAAATSCPCLLPAPAGQGRPGCPPGPARPSQAHRSCLMKRQLRPSGWVPPP